MADRRHPNGADARGNNPGRGPGWRPSGTRTGQAHPAKRIPKRAGLVRRICRCGRFVVYGPVHGRPGPVQAGSITAAARGIPTGSVFFSGGNRGPGRRGDRLQGTDIRLPAPLGRSCGGIHLNRLVCRPSLAGGTDHPDRWRAGFCRGLPHGKEPDGAYRHPRAGQPGHLHALPALVSLKSCRVKTVVRHLRSDDQNVGY